MQFSSKLLEEAVAEFAKLPGIGSKTALRLVLHLLNQPLLGVQRFSDTLLNLRENIRFCSNCGNLSDTPLCEICSNPKRDHTLICVVEDSRDVMAIESTRQFSGLYHVLNGLISPMDGIGPSDLNIARLIDRVGEGNTREVILALNPTMEGDTTTFYIHKKLHQHPVSISAIARGIAFGSEIEYTDETTLGRSIATRTPLNL